MTSIEASINRQPKIFRFTMLAAAGAGLLVCSANGQPFVYSQTDLYLGFRTPSTLSNQAVVNIGSALNFVSLPAGSSNLVIGFSPSQLNPDSFGLNNLSWSVGSCVKNGSVPGYPLDTIWVTSPRSNPNVQTAPPFRWDQDTLASVVFKIDAVLGGAVQISKRMSAGPDNTTTFVREPGPNSGNISLNQTYYDFVSSTQTGLGTYQDNWYDVNFVPQNVENTTSASFSTPVRSDFYEVRADGFLDPHTGQTSGNAYYVGYFQFNTNGTMSFIRASASVTPPAPTIKLTRTGISDSIAFLSSSGATYTLYASDSLTTPFSSWTQVGSTISGDGTMKSFPDVTGASMKFYRVTAQ